MIAAERLKLLTAAQRKCLQLYWTHRSATGVARELNLSTHTVNNHLMAARKALAMTSSLAAARSLALQEGRLASDIITSERIPIPSNDLTGEWGVGAAITASVVRDAASVTGWQFDGGDRADLPERSDRNTLSISERLIAIGKHSMTITTFVATLLLLAYLAQHLSRP